MIKWKGSSLKIRKVEEEGGFGERNALKGFGAHLSKDRETREQTLQTFVKIAA